MLPQGLQQPRIASLRNVIGAEIEGHPLHHRRLSRRRVPQAIRPLSTPRGRKPASPRPATPRTQHFLNSRLRKLPAIRHQAGRHPASSTHAAHRRLHGPQASRKAYPAERSARYTTDSRIPILPRHRVGDPALESSSTPPLIVTQGQRPRGRVSQRVSGRITDQRPAAPPAAKGDICRSRCPEKNEDYRHEVENFGGTDADND